jgi:hypothetical protein
MDTNRPRTSPNPPSNSDLTTSESAAAAPAARTQKRYGRRDATNDTEEDVVPRPGAGAGIGPRVPGVVRAPAVLRALVRRDRAPIVVLRQLPERVRVHASLAARGRRRRRRDRLPCHFGVVDSRRQGQVGSEPELVHAAERRQRTAGLRNAGLLGGGAHVARDGAALLLRGPGYIGGGLPKSAILNDANNRDGFDAISRDSRLVTLVRLPSERVLP